MLPDKCDTEVEAVGGLGSPPVLRHGHRVPLLEVQQQRPAPGQQVQVAPQRLLTGPDCSNQHGFLPEELLVKPGRVLPTSNFFHACL